MYVHAEAVIFFLPCANRETSMHTLRHYEEHKNEARFLRHRVTKRGCSSVVERLLCMQEVLGSKPCISTFYFRPVISLIILCVSILGATILYIIHQRPYSIASVVRIVINIAKN